MYILRSILFCFVTECTDRIYFNKTVDFKYFHSLIQILFRTFVFFFFSFYRSSYIYIYINIAQEGTRDVYIMFSGRGYCTQPTCFPVLGAPPILVFLCKTHCRHMLCYRHWLSHQTNKTDEQEIDQSLSSVYFTRIER
jgi:hypothetical protein